MKLCEGVDFRHAILIKTFMQFILMQKHIQFGMYPLFTKYRCILITGVFRFLHMTIACDIIIQNFPLNFVYNAFLSLHQRKKAEMSFLRVSDLLYACVVLNHDADSSLYTIKNNISLKIKEKMPFEKFVCLL